MTFRLTDRCLCSSIKVVPSGGTALHCSDDEGNILLEVDCIMDEKEMADLLSIAPVLSFAVFG